MHYSYTLIFLCCVILTGVCLFRSVLQGSTAAETRNVDGEGYATFVLFILGRPIARVGSIEPPAACISIAGTRLSYREMIL